MIQVELYSNMFDKLRKNISRIIYSASNSMSLPNEFLRYGNQKTMVSDWDDVLMSDKDHYTGYSYAAITKRARAVSKVASNFITTKIKADTSKTPNDIPHPYLPLIEDAQTFSEDYFWQTISTYLDLEGVFYLMVLRNPDGEANPNGSGDLGAPQQFKLLNPYNIQRVMNKETLEVGAYIETRKGFQRKIPAQMIIPIWELNPFDEDKPYAMTDAARDSSYTLKSSGDWTRKALRNNASAPGIISTDVLLPDAQFKNFVARIQARTKGEPLYGNGSGAVKWEPMNTDLSKAALKEINEVQRDQSFAVYGVSKTLMGIEQSGTTRETSNVQKELFMENEIIPRINLILSALNLDYKNRYKSQYQKKKLVLALNNPIESDQDVEGLKADNKTTSYDLFQSLVDDGYTEDIASKFVSGEIDLDQLGKPTNEPKPDPTTVVAPTATPKRVKKKEGLVLNEVSQNLIEDQQSTLQNAIVNVEGMLAVAAINRVPKDTKKNAVSIDEESDLITKSDKKEAMNELILILTGFYGIVTSLQGKETMLDRIEEFGGAGKYIMDKISRDGIKATAKLVAESHVDSVSKELYTVAREAALQGKSQLQIIADLKERYSHDITENRAKLVARTETNRAFTMAQYDADRQFIAQNKLQDRAFKQYHTRSTNPCPFCTQLASQGLIPFDQPFVKNGGSVNAKDAEGKEVTYKVNFQSVYAGNLHPNCNCDYELVIVKEKK